MKVPNLPYKAGNGVVVRRYDRTAGCFVVYLPDMQPPISVSYPSVTIDGNFPISIPPDWHLDEWRDKIAKDASEAVADYISLCRQSGQVASIDSRQMVRAISRYERNEVLVAEDQSE